jgi:branched-chain amino acid transport system substrate-binding protein
MAQICKSALLLLIFSLSSVLPVFAEQPLEIGWSGPLSGPCAVVGIDAVPAIQMVFDRVNAQGGIKGHPLRLVVEDDLYNATKAVTAYKKLVSNNKVPFIFASTYAGVFATAHDAVNDKVLIIDTLDCNEDLAELPENTLCLATKTESIAQGFVNDIVSKKYKAVLILIEESDGWMQLIARNASAGLRKAGVKVLEESSLPSTTDYAPSLIRGRSAKVEALIALGNDQMGTAFRQARTLGMHVQFYGVGSILSPGFQALAKNTIEGALASSWLPAASQAYEEFLTAFKARIGRAPYLELSVVPAYDAANILIGCLNGATDQNGSVDSSKLRACFLATKNLNGASGTISFDPDGAVRSIHERLFKVHDGKLSPL